jgi:hypothetical protein
MGELIQKFTFGRNTLKRSPAESASAVISNIAKAEQGIDLQVLKRDDNGAYNVIRDLISFSGVLERDGDACRVTKVGDDFRRLYSLNGEDAWRWLITRSLWLYVVPNGTGSEINAAARQKGISFNFFRTVLGLLWHMYTLPGESRFLYYDELCALLDDDGAWKLDAGELFASLLKLRQTSKSEPTPRRGLLGDLEDAYKVPRDNLNTVFNKAFQQTGLFEYAFNGNRMVGVAIAPNLDSVLQNRIRFVLDHPQTWSSGDWSEFVQLRDPDLPQELSNTLSTSAEDRPPLDFQELLTKCATDLAVCGLRLPDALLHRTLPSLLSKRFLIFTGLAGSGKTKLAQAVARWLTKDPRWIDAGDHSKGKHPNSCFALVPVGADWTGNDNIIGYADGLQVPAFNGDGSLKTPGVYLSKPALDLMLHAQTHADVPHFLILDEMNLSHVERYFADLLSLIESKESLTLYCDRRGADGKPENTRGLDPILKLPPNLFILGTVNVDETTYMFSPKVLDRANVIEFRVSSDDMKAFLDQPVSPKLEDLDGKGFDAGFATPFVHAAKGDVPALAAPIKERYESEMKLFFEVLQGHGAEFGYRVAHESARFVHHYQSLGAGKVWDPEADAGEGRKGKWADKDGAQRDWFDHALDAVAVQKFLPKLHGSKVKLGPLLKKLYTVSIQRPAADARTAKVALDKQIEPSRDIPKDARYPLTAEKIARMWRQLNENGFTSFPEN